MAPPPRDEAPLTAKVMQFLGTLFGHDHAGLKAAAVKAMVKDFVGCVLGRGIVEFDDIPEEDLDALDLEVGRLLNAAP